ncbi:hypothetical protein C8Q74DRAFT_1307540 [Fomes fomentarius]|nr:hypothetical protein C8Q74DRAFT_1307540 [Fomes fomentarius]
MKTCRFSRSTTCTPELNVITRRAEAERATISRHLDRKLAECSQHSADRLPYDKNRNVSLQSLCHKKFLQQAWPSSSILMGCVTVLFPRNSRETACVASGVSLRRTA